MNIRWGILSTGRIAHKFADTAIHFGREITIGAVASRSLAPAEAFAAQYGIPKAYGSYEEMAEDPDIDIVYIGTPHHLHEAHMRLCLTQGKHVLCEKPFTVNAREARRVCDLAREKGLLVLEAFWTKFIPIYRRVERLLSEGAIGDVCLVKTQFGYPADPSRWRMDAARAGGALLDIGVYNIGFISMILGYHPAEIKTIAQISDSGVDMCSSVILRYENGAVAECTTAFNCRIPDTATIYGTKGRIHIPHYKNPRRVEIFMNDGSVSVIEEALGYPGIETMDYAGFEGPMLEAVACLAAGRTESGILTPAQTIATLEIMDAVRELWGMRYPFEA